MQFVVETAGVTHWVAVTITTPEGGDGCVAVSADLSKPPVARLKKDDTALFLYFCLYLKIGVLFIYLFIFCITIYQKGNKSGNISEFNCINDDTNINIYINKNENVQGDLKKACYEKH